MNLITTTFFITLFLLGAALIERQRVINRIKGIRRETNLPLRTFTIRNLFLN